MTDESTALDRIDHIFVLMLENRSFDHAFGSDPLLQSGPPLSGTESCPYDPEDPHGPSVPVTLVARDVAEPDAPHEFRDVCYQIAGRRDGTYPPGSQPMNGFAASAREGLLECKSESKKRRHAPMRGNGAYAMNCQSNIGMPVLRALAREFVVCDHWYSSMPGPTWPNRFFVHAGSSGGLDNSPKPLKLVGSMALDALGFRFEHGTIFNQLGNGNWRVYHDDWLPQVLAIRGMSRSFVGSRRKDFRSVDDLAGDLRSGAFAPKYVFIEPAHDALDDGRNGNSQHPVGKVSAGEELIRKVYLAIAESPVWERSLLVVTYDEHGGFYDRVEPPRTEPPGDEPLNREEAEFPANFGFDRLGVRVPAVVISPWVERGTVDSRVYDHTSILRTLHERFGLSRLSRREGAVASLAGLLTEEAARTDCPDSESLPQPIAFGDELAAMRGPEDDSEPLEASNLAGFVRIAAEVRERLEREKRTGLSYLLKSVQDAVVPWSAVAPLPRVATLGDARAYLSEVSQMLEAGVSVPLGSR